MRQNITITPETQQLDEVTVVSTGVSRLKRSAFNAVAVDTEELQNTTRNLSDALAKAPGMKLRESGGGRVGHAAHAGTVSAENKSVLSTAFRRKVSEALLRLNNIP